MAYPEVVSGGGFPKVANLSGIGHVDHVDARCAGGREFEPRPGHYSRMSFSSDQATGTVFPHLNMPFLPNSKFI